MNNSVAVVALPATNIYPAGGKRVAITLTCILIVILELLDMTIVNVALPDIKGGLSATITQISWVSTSYIIAAALVTPLTGYLTSVFGRKRLLIFDIIIFTLFSMLCGSSTSIGELVFFRILQGAASGTMVPLAQDIMLSSYPPEDHTKAMAMFGVGVILGPVVGPYLGGIIINSLAWRWIFYVNLPIGLISGFMISKFISENVTHSQKVDTFGLMLLSMAIICLELILSQGNEHGWFNSNYIISLSAIFIISLMAFVIFTLDNKHPVFRIQLLANRNFAMSCILLVIFGSPQLGGMVMLSLFMGGALNYPALTIGKILMIRGLAAGSIMPVLIRLQKKVEVRVFLLIGILLSSFSNYLLSHLTLDVAENALYLPCILQGWATGLIMIPLMSVSFSTLPKEAGAEASGLFNLIRSIGSSVGITICTTLFSMLAQVKWQVLGENFFTENPALQQWFSANNLTANQPFAYQRLAQLLQSHADMISYTSVFHFICFASLLMLIPLLFIRPPKLE